MTAPAVFDNRPTATYANDVRTAVGQVVGPTLWGELLVVDEVDYSPQTGHSVVRFRRATTHDMPTVYGNPEAFVSDRPAFVQQQIIGGAR